MGIHDSLAEQREAIRVVLVSADIGNVYLGQIDDPIPPCMLINDPEIVNQQGTMFAVTRTIRLFKPRVDPTATSVAFDRDVPAVLKALFTINGAIPQGVVTQQPVESGYALPTAIILVQLPFSLC